MIRSSAANNRCSKAAWMLGITKRHTDPRTVIASVSPEVPRGQVAKKTGPAAFFPSRKEAGESPKFAGQALVKIKRPTGP